MITAMIGRRYRSTFGMDEPSAYPARVRPRLQTRPPTTCHRVNVRTGTWSAPAIGFSTVRTTGTKRASTIAFACPYRSSSSSARCAPACNRGEPLRASRAPPALRPMR